MSETIELMNHICEKANPPYWASKSNHSCSASAPALQTLTEAKEPDNGKQYKVECAMDQDSAMNLTWWVEELDYNIMGDW